MHFHASISSFVRKDFTAALPKLVNDTTFVTLWLYHNVPFAAFLARLFVFGGRQ